MLPTSASFFSNFANANYEIRLQPGSGQNLSDPNSIYFPLFYSITNANTATPQSGMTCPSS
jgi:hypothetical protein